MDTKKAEYIGILVPIEVFSTAKIGVLGGIAKQKSEKLICLQIIFILFCRLVKNTYLCKRKRIAKYDECLAQLLKCSLHNPIRVRYTEVFALLSEGFIILLYMRKKVIVYVDGFNFYYGLKHSGRKWKRIYWLDIVKFFESMMKPDQELVEVNYYSARPINDHQAYNNQDDLFCANQLNPKFKLHLGRYKKKSFKCHKCHYNNSTYEEKETDVRVATGMLVDVFKKRCDITVIVSADSDMIPSVEIIKTFDHSHPVYAFIPPSQKSFALAAKCDGIIQLGKYRPRFLKAMLPENIKPTNWT